MISDFDTHSHAQLTPPGRTHSRRSSARFETHPALKDEADPINTRFLLFPAVQPAQTFPWFTAVLDGMTEPLSRYHE